MKTYRFAALALAGSFAGVLGACSSASQPISGQVAQDTFPSAVVTVRAARPGAASIEAPVGDDGTFRIALPRGRHYRLEFVSADGTPRLVLPRRAGKVEWQFDVRGGGPAFDLGAVRYVGDPSQMLVTFLPAVATVRSAQTLAGAPAAAPDADDVECENGRDARTGAVCVDDDDDDGGMCQEGDDDEGEHDDQDGDDVECENGVDAKTGAACTDDDAAGDVGAPETAAVADHNLPATLGACGEDDDEGDDDGDND